MKRIRRRMPAAVLLALVLGCLGVWLYLRWLEESYQPPNYAQIEDGLYVGGNNTAPPPGTRAVLNVCESKDRYTCEVHLWDPIKDAAPAPSLEWLRKKVEFVDKHCKAGLPIFVHCHAGVSRSVMVVTAYLMFKHHWTRDQALAFVRQNRPLARPNPAFMELLLEWESALKEPAQGDS